MRKFFLILVVTIFFVNTQAFAAVVLDTSLKQDPVISPSIVTSPQDGKEQGFTVQVYSFLDSMRAQKAVEALKMEGHKAFQEVSDLGEKGTFYRVRIGSLVNEAQAQALLEDIRKNYKDGFIAKK